MCLIVFAWQRHPRYRLILAGNRDELYRRPTGDMQWWPDAPSLLAGRDLQAGGTWLAIGRNGRFATVTNYRESMRTETRRRSRGELVSRFVTGTNSPTAYCADISGSDYAGFSLLTSDIDTLYYASNRDPARRTLDAGIYGLSNAALDTPWPKVVRCRRALAELIARDAVNPNALFTLLADTRPAPTEDVPEGDLPFPLARAVSAPFIRTRDYGTRCTTVVLVGVDDNVLVAERRFDANGERCGDAEFRFKIVPGPHP
ncbi:MAG TPA: NRDE family protein [Woeseiaceae bacterium]|nr:NRDE family protein [Woeseiaceae bacterium]